MINKLKQKRVEHSFIAKSLHWLFVAIFGYGVFKQIESKEQLNDILLFRSEMLFASIFFLFLMVRFFYMKRRYKTSLPSETPKLHRIVAKFVHKSLYVTISGIAISGLGIGFIFWLGYKNSYLIEVAIRIHECFFFDYCLLDFCACVGGSISSNST